MFKRYIYMLMAIFFVQEHEGARAQHLDCSRYKGVDNENIAYKKRGNRCEGMYRSNVSSGESLILVNLTQGKINFDLKNDTVLYIYSPQVYTEQVNIEGRGIHSKTYYRLDALLEPEKKFEWPLDIVKTENLASNKIGVIGKIAGKDDIYLPLATTKQDSTNQESTFLFLTLRSSDDIYEVTYRKNDMQAFECNLKNVENKKVGSNRNGRFFSGQPINIELPIQPNDFCIQFQAEAEGSGSIFYSKPIKIRMKGK